MVRSLKRQVSFKNFRRENTSKFFPEKQNKLYATFAVVKATNDL